MDDLQAIFSPKSVAVIGASTIPGKVGHGIFVNILKGEIQGTLFPINPTARSVKSVKAYPTILDVPDTVDLSIIILPPEVALVSLSDMVRNHPEIKEMDLNPMIVHERGKGATVADCRIILEPRKGEKE